MAASQERTLQLFTALKLLQPDWGGSLLVCAGLNEAARPLALAALAAGAASLFLEDDPTLLRLAVREGCCTFAVTTLDEALRILKNELRQRRAISVALHHAASETLAEILERGVQPQALMAARLLGAEEAQSFHHLQARGAKFLSGPGLPANAAATDLQYVLEGECDGWNIVTDVATDLAERRAADALLLAAVERAANGPAALHAGWLGSAPTLFPRSLERALWRRIA